MGYVVCGGCAARIPPANWNQEYDQPCPVCGRAVTVTVFPVALRPPAPAVPEPVLTGQEAGCFHHTGNRAVAACDNCGRFLCAVCDIETAGGHICPACFDRTDQPAAHERVNYDTVALALVTWPMLLCWVPVLTTPAALFFAFKFWNAPSPVFPRGRWRLWLTLVIAALQVAAVIAVMAFLLPKGGRATP